MIGKPIFFDPTGRRGRVLAQLAWALGTISALVTVVFMATLVVVDRPGVGAPGSHGAASLDPLRLGADLLGSACA